VIFGKPVADVWALRIAVVLVLCAKLVGATSKEGF